MPRSVGVTVSAVVAIIGSAFTLLCGAMMVLAPAFVSKSSAPANVPENLGSFIVIDAVFFFGFGGWGLASGIGLIYLKKWARISLLIFAGFLVCISLLTMAFIAFIPLPNTHDPSLPANFMSVMRVGMVLFYGMFAGLGGLWLYFFNKRSVKVQFQAVQPAPESVAGDLFFAAAMPVPSPSQRTRPLSITIIGWFLLIGSVFAPLSLLFNRVLFPGVQLPFYFLGFFFFGWSAYLVLIVWMAAQMVAAVGLLRLKNWGLFAAIALQCLGALNAALLISIPGHRARFQELMETMMASMNAHMPQAVPFPFPIWIGLAMGFPIILVILWFLITRRHGFTSAAQESASKSS